MGSQELKKKPLAYLDQNIYSKMRSNNELKEFVKENYIVLYSDTTLDEFEGNPDLTEIYITILNEFDNMFIQHALDQNFEDTDNCRFANIRPNSVLAMRAEKKSMDDDYPLNSMLRMANKHFGGLKGITFESLAEEHREMAKKKIREVEGILEVVNEIPGDLADKLKNMKEKLDPTFDELNVTYRKNIPNQENYRGPKEHREKIGLGPNELNNLRPPRIIDQILDLIMAYPEVKASGMTPDRIFGFEYLPRNTPLSKSEKIGIIYQWLNFIGFNPDSRMERENRMKASFRDQLHASLASFSNIFFTMDEAFSKKVAAIYEYLEIETVVAYLDDRNLDKKRG